MSSGNRLADLAPLLEKLEIESGDDLAPALHVVGVFIDKGPQMMEAVLSAATDADAGRLEMAAHSLKSSAAYVGADELYQICVELELAGRSGEIGGIHDRVIDLERIFPRVMRAVEIERHRLEADSDSGT